MMYHDFSSVKESDMVSVDRTQLIEVVANSVFRTDSPFIADSVVVSVRGLTRDRAPGGDYELISDTDFRVDCPLEDTDNLIVTYLKK